MMEFEDVQSIVKFIDVYLDDILKQLDQFDVCMVKQKAREKLIQTYFNINIIPLKTLSKLTDIFINAFESNTGLDEKQVGFCLLGIYETEAEINKIVASCLEDYSRILEEPKRYKIRRYEELQRLLINHNTEFSQMVSSYFRILSEEFVQYHNSKVKFMQKK